MSHFWDIVIVLLKYLQQNFISWEWLLLYSAYEPKNMVREPSAFQELLFEKYLFYTHTSRKESLFASSSPLLCPKSKWPEYQMNRQTFCLLNAGWWERLRSLSEAYPNTGELVFYVMVVLSCASQTFFHVHVLRRSISLHALILLCCTPWHTGWGIVF